MAAFPLAASLRLFLAAQLLVLSFVEAQSSRMSNFQMPLVESCNRLRWPKLWMFRKQPSVCSTAVHSTLSDSAVDSMYRLRRYDSS